MRPDADRRGNWLCEGASLKVGPEQGTGGGIVDLIRGFRRLASRRMALRLLTGITGVLGLAAAVSLIVDNGPARIAALVGLAGFGLLWLLPVRLLTMVLNAQGWRVLFPKTAPVSLWLLTWAAFVRNAINTLLPVAHVGGEVMATRLLAKRGVGLPIAIASIVVETTVTLFVQMGMTLVGLGLLASYIGDPTLSHSLLVGLAIAFPVALLFVLVQVRSAPFSRLQPLMRRLTGPLAASLLDGEAVDAALRSLYTRIAALGCCALWQGLSMLGGAGEFWVILRLLHEPVSLRLVVMLEVLIQALQSAAFIVPGALGVQEGGLVAVGAAAGLSAEVALAMSLIRRIRQVGVSLPVLLVWMRTRGNDRPLKSEPA